MESPRSPGLLGEAHGPAWLVRAAAIGIRLLVLGVVVWLAAELATKVTLLLVAVLVGLLLAGVFAPAVRWGARHRVPPGAAAAAAVVVVLALVAGAAAGIGARVEEQLPQLREEMQSASQQLSDTLGVEIPGLGSGSEESSDGSSGSGSTEASGDSSGSGSSMGGSSIFGDVLSSVRVVFDVLIGFFLTLAFMFLFLKNGPAMWGWLLEKLGGRVRDDVDAAGRAAWGTVGAYVRGLTIVAAFDALGIGVGLLLLGVPL
ncbi:AI-2E family transporter, partial [Georgenia sp. 10Sc9-8]|nr:AI-2E family transporter [Georgenia halotolerans]